MTIRMRPTSAFVNIAALAARRHRLDVAPLYPSLGSPKNSHIQHHHGGLVAATTTSTAGVQNRCIILQRSLSASSSCNENDEEKHDKFFRMEHRNWEKGFEEYDSGFGPLTRQTIPTLLTKAGFPPSEDDAGSSSGSDGSFRLLDVATGPGFVLSAALKMASASTYSIQLTGLDITQNFLSMAKQRIDAQQQNQQQKSKVNVDFVEGNAESLPFSDNTFDSIVCNFGILHFFKQETFLRECFRVLKPGGRVSFTAWAPPTRTEGFGITLNAIADVGNPNVAVPEGPNFFRFGDSEEATKTLEGIGYVNVGAVELSEMKWNNVNSGEMLYHILLNGTVRTREILLGQTEVEAEAVKILVKDMYDTITGGGKRALAMPAVVSSGQKPF